MWGERFAFPPNSYSSIVTCYMQDDYYPITHSSVTPTDLSPNSLMSWAVVVHVHAVAMPYDQKYAK
jgi:hypothetical protein